MPSRSPAPPPTVPSLDAVRVAAQQAFDASGAPLVVGDARRVPWTAAQCQALQGGEAAVEAVIDAGLTAQVLRLWDGAQRWTLKRRRTTARVHNVDGALSFLNEVQRRAELERLKLTDPARWAGLVDTAWADYRAGVIVSPWIDGEPVEDWNAERFAQLFGLLTDLWLEGFFEWDLSAGNLLLERGRVRLFDFGYCYRFDPLRHFSSAGWGREALFHPVERFESRCFAAVLMRLAESRGDAVALQAFRLEKEVALQAYERVQATCRARGAEPAVLDWWQGWVRRWRAALRGPLQDLYLAECWRSHALDLDDDLRGRSCTPVTLRRADWLRRALRDHGPALQAQGAFFGADAELSLPALRQRYDALRLQAERHQQDPA